MSELADTHPLIGRRGRGASSLALAYTRLAERLMHGLDPDASDRLAAAAVLHADLDREQRLRDVLASLGLRRECLPELAELDRESWPKLAAGLCAITTAQISDVQISDAVRDGWHRHIADLVYEAIAGQMGGGHRPLERLLGPLPERAASRREYAFFAYNGWKPVVLAGLAAEEGERELMLAAAASAQLPVVEARMAAEYGNDSSTSAGPSASSQ